MQPLAAMTSRSQSPASTLGTVDGLHPEVEAALEESQRALSTLLGNLPGMAYRCRNDREWSSEFVSDGCFGLTGYTAAEFTAQRVSYNDLIHPEDRDWLWADTQDALRAHRPFQQEYRIRTASGDEKWVWEQGRGVYHQDGSLVALEGLVLDITRRKRVQAELEVQTTLLAAQAQLLDLAHDAIVAWDLKTGAIKFWNRGAEELYGWKREEVLTRTPQAILHTEFPRPLTEINAELMQGGRWEGELVHTRRDGSRVVVASRWALQEDKGGEPVAVLGINRDVTERKEAEAALKHQARHDVLTNLPNRLLLRERVEEAFVATTGGGQGAALLMLDLDRFKDVNDTLGHDQGDRLLQAVSQRLSSVLRPTQTVARLGGDEFAVLLPASDEVAACQCAEALVEALDPPFTLDGHRLALAVSIGIALAPQHGQTFETLLRHADVAMYLAKREGAGYTLYSAEQDRHNLNDLALVAELRGAIEQNDLLLHYQPQFDCQSGALAGVEALVRWLHPERGLIPPDQFIPQAEQTGLIRPLTQWVIANALPQSYTWRRRGLDFTVAVNLSMRSLHDPDLPESIQGRLARWHLPPRALKIEITESSLMADPSRALAVLTRLNEMGIRIAIDDFGTGYSSLAYLKDLPVHELKIDRSFVSGLTQHARDRAIVRSMIDMAHHLGLQVVAEGVEDRETFELLAELGCDLAQGYYLSRPLPAAEVLSRTQWLAPEQLSLKPAA
jgi:diguanylate cyclase (GGDEF)-like protein/PAS domain S-box-containing protein